MTARNTPAWLLASLLIGAALIGTAFSAAPAAAQNDLRLQEPGGHEAAAPGLGVGTLQLGGTAEGTEDENDAVAPAPIQVELDEALDEALEAEFGDEPELIDDPAFAHGEAAHGEAAHDAHDAAGHAAHGDAAHDEHGHGAGGHGAGGHGDEHGGHHAEFDSTEFIATLINFAIWLAIIIFLGRKPLMSYLAERRRSVEEGLVEAARLEKEAKTKHAEYSERLAHLDEELEKLKGEMVQAGEAEADRIIAEAEERAARMRRDAEFRIAQQMKQLRADLTREAIEAAVGAAERVLTDAVAAPDHERLANEYLEQLNTSMEEEVRA